MTTIPKSMNFAQATLAAAQADRAAGKARRHAEHVVHRGFIAVSHAEQDLISDLEKQAAKLEMVTAVVEGAGYVASAGTSINKAQQARIEPESTQSPAEVGATAPEEAELEEVGVADEVVEGPSEEEGGASPVEMFQTVFEKTYGVVEENFSRNNDAELEDASEGSAQAQKNAGRVQQMIDDEQSGIDALMQIRRTVFELNGVEGVEE